MNGLFEMGVNLLEDSMAIAFLTLYFNSKYSGLKKYAVCFSAVAVIFLYMTFINVPSKFGGFLDLGYLLICVAYSVIFLKGDKYTRIFIACFSDVVLNFSVLVTMCTVAAVHGGYISDKIFILGPERIEIVIISKIICIVAYLILLKFRLENIVSARIAIVIIFLTAVSRASLIGLIGIFIGNTEFNSMILLASTSVVIANALTYYLFIKISRDTEREAEFRAIQSKNEVDFTKYNLLKRKYEDMRIMAHDFNKYCKNIESMLGENSDAALEMIRSLESKNRSLLLVEYTDNNALNVLLTQKSEERSQSGIDFQVYIKDVSLSFINEADTVAIFANLMDNAIEASSKSAAKKIFLSIYEMNSAFTVIRLTF